MVLKDNELKNIIEEDFNLLKKMEIPEYILYQKWCEINNKFKSADENVNIFFNTTVDPLPNFDKSIKNNIWVPEKWEDYIDLEPEVIHVDNENDRKIWNSLRIFICRMKWSKNIGRFANFYVKDKKTNKYLGVFSIGSDFMYVGGRDKYIGWTKEHKIDNKRLNHTCMGSTIVPTQPIGYNYLGGKLMSLLVCSNVAENAWNNKYEEKLAGITTTSLYGGFSQYNNLKYWKKCKSSEGKMITEPSENVYNEIKKWYKHNYPEDYKRLIGKSHPKNTIILKVLSLFKIKPLINNAPRGVYFCSLYDNTIDFLSMKSDTLGNKKFDNSVESLVDLWKQKYASKRINKLIDDNRTKNGILFYDELIGMSWEETKQKYLND